MKAAKLFEKFKLLSLKDKLMLIAASAMTIALIITMSTMAWFAQEKKIATMAKIDSPARLTLKSGAAEDIIQFKMSGIDVTQGNTKDFVFCVEGDITRYNLQLTHTTNIDFEYTIYRAVESDSGVEYVKENREDVVYYRKDAVALPGAFVNPQTDASSSRRIGNSSYEEASYDSSDDRQKFAEPLYWQTTTAIDANDVSYDEITEDETEFRNYFILEVTWGSNVVNDKETDIIYITAQAA